MVEVAVKDKFAFNLFLVVLEENSQQIIFQLLIQAIMELVLLN
jgi:hypothetical protein